MSEAEQDRWIAGFVEDKRRELGADFWLEPLLEITEAQRAALADTPFAGGAKIVTTIMLIIITSYWAKIARQALVEQGDGRWP